MKAFVITVIVGLLLSLAVPVLTGDENNLAFNWIFKTPWLLCLLIWNLYALFDARREALYFTLKARNPSLDEYTDHSFYFVQRGLVLVLIGFILQRFYPLFLLAAMFPFVHDGMYYWFRDNLDNSYPKRWISQPKKSTAIFDIVFKYFPVRIVVFLIALGLYLYEYL